MEKLRAHYTGTSGSFLLSDTFQFWTFSQAKHESIQEWEVKNETIKKSLCLWSTLALQRQIGIWFKWRTHENKAAKNPYQTR